MSLFCILLMLIVAYSILLHEPSGIHFFVHLTTTPI